MNLIDPKQIRGFEERLSLISSEYTQLDNDFLKSSGGLLSGQLIVSGELNYNILNISGYNNKLNLWNQSDSGNLTLNNPLNTAIDCFINIGSNNNYDANFNIININNKNIQIGLDNTANLLISGTDFVKINLYDENYMNFSNSGTKIYSKISTDYKNIIDDGFYYLENISGKIDEINLDEYVMANYLVIANSDSFNK